MVMQLRVIQATLDCEAGVALFLASWCIHLSGCTSSMIAVDKEEWIRTIFRFRVIAHCVSGLELIPAGPW